MEPPCILLINASILTAYGLYRYEPLTIEDARRLVTYSQSNGVQLRSAIGHAATAKLLTRLLGVEVPVNRIAITQQVGEQAIVFRLKDRPPEGAILSETELEAIGYELGLLTRLE
ncbi:MAG: YddF family protein [Chloracidobacterium sp.]|nr:YddF family protein [Chloracidobacterium sp.]MDW8217836.1 YddF family protein [Acidobacteriota bacterium]